MINVAFVRGAYLNNFEGQNYIFDKDITLTAFSSKYALHTSFPFPVTRLQSVHDLHQLLSSPLLHKILKYITNRLLGDSQLLFGLERYMTNFDIVQTADAHYYYSYQLAKLRKDNKIKKLVVTSWETIPFNNESVMQKKHHKYFVYRYADAFLCYSQKAKDCLITEGVESNKIRLISLGVDLNTFKPSNKGVSTNSILFVGRLVQEKGVMDLYEAYKHIAQNAKLHIVGSGLLQKLLVRQISQDKLEDNVTIESKTYNQMPEVYGDSMLMVLPSKTSATWEEQYGMVLIEALATGLPIIAYDTGAIKEVIGNAGYVIKPSVAELTTTLSQLIHNKKLMKHLGIIARERAVTRFNSKKTAEKLKDFYKDLLKI